MNSRTILAFALLLPSLSIAQVDKDALPTVEDGFAINFFVREPHIINPSSLCFDHKGRLYVGAGPQYRSPKEDSPTDYIKILIDKDGDGEAETVKTFAEGLNCVQAMAWKGNELWVANAPELTVLRDTDGDDVADEYQIIYTGLNNLRHSLHGLNWGPDGWLYMSLGNTWVKKNAPKPIRDLMGIKSDDQTPYPLTKVYTKETYQKTYHPMNKDEKEGGIFRCKPGGYDLELYARGMRNPWDICMDSGFNWLGTDNDPGRPAERIFMPVPWGHYSMRHPWKFDWMGHHPAVAPSSDLFPSVSGSGTGVVFYDTTHFPEPYRRSYLIADWTNNCIFFYQWKWDGSLQVPTGPKRKLVDGGVTQGGDLGYRGAKGRALFRPTDIDVGPDGALYMAGWGSVYGTEYVPKEKWTAEENAKYQGRVFRLRHKESPLIPREKWYPPKRDKDLASWSFQELIDDIGHQVQVWRVQAQDELIRRGIKVRPAILKALDSGKLDEAQATWTVWALGHIDAKNQSKFQDIVNFATGQRKTTLNTRVQATRILGDKKVFDAVPVLVRLLKDPEPRVRLAAIQSLGRIGWGEHVEDILDALSQENDRLTLYTGWQVLRRQVPSVEARRTLLSDERGGVRFMALLSLMEERKVSAPDVFPMLNDSDEAVASLAADWLQTTGATKAKVTISTPERNFRNSAEIALVCNKNEYSIRYTLDGSAPTKGSAKYAGKFVVDQDVTIKAAAFAGDTPVSTFETLTIHRITDSEWKDRLFVRKVAAKGSKEPYSAVDDGLQRGVRAYLGENKETITSVPDEVAGATLLRTSSADAHRSDADFLSFELNLPAKLYVAYDTRFLKQKPAWLREGFAQSKWTITTSKASNGEPGKDGGHFTLFQKEVSAGTVVLGGNKPEGDKLSSMFQVYLSKAGAQKTTVEAALAKMSKASTTRGKEIYFGRGTCFACHQAEGRGIVLGPDLNGIRTRQDLNYVLKSIVDPDAYIVEGFQQTSLKLKDGRELFGMIQEETDQNIKIFLPTGERVIIHPKEVAKRSDAKNSGMPASFAYTLSPQDLADLTAWIMTLKKEPATK